MAFVPYKKKDKKNDGKDSTRPVPEFKSMPPTKETAPVSGLPLDDTEDGDQVPGLVRKSLALCCLPFLVSGVWLKKAGLASWCGIVWCCIRLGRVSSFFVRKPSDEEYDETEMLSTEPLGRLPTISSPAAISSSTGSQTSSSPKTVTPRTSVDDPEFDEDEEKFNWLNIGTKLAALAAIGLLLVGGFYGTKTYLVSSKKTNAQPPIESTGTNPNDVPPIVDHSLPPVANPPTKSNDKPPTPSKKADDDGLKDPVVPTPSKKTNNNVQKELVAPAAPKAADDNAQKAPVASPPPEKNAENPSTVEPPPTEANPWNVSTVTNTANPLLNNDWDPPVPSTPVAAEPKDLTHPIPVAPAWSISDPPIPTSPSVSPPSVASTDPLASIPAALAIAPSPAEPENSEPLVPSPQPITSSIPTHDIEKPLSVPDPATTLKPLTIPPPAPTTSSFDVMDSKPEFQMAPVPPDKDASLTESRINSLPHLTPITPVSEVVPGIPSSGSLEPIITSAPPTPKVHLEPAPGIPEPMTIPESTATFAVPNLTEPNAYVPPPVIAPLTVPPIEPLTAFVPPPLASPSPPLPPVSASALEEIPVEPAIGIPEPIIPTVATSPIIPVANPVPPMEMPHPSENLQDHSATIPSAMNPAFSQPRIATPDGTVQYNSAPIAVNTAVPLPIPSDLNDPTLNPLLNLNPSEIAPVVSDGPPAKLATPEPKYQNSQGTTVPEGSATYRQKTTIISIPDAQLYIVEPGDTYMTISTRFYNTSLLYRALAVHNRRLGVAWLPDPGTELEIPPSEYLQTNYAEILSRSGERSNLPTSGERRIPSSIATMVPATAITVRQGTRYIVREGDTVFKIAEERLRDTGRWKDIIQWNSDQLHDARDLRPGMEIVLPAIR